MYLLPLTSFSPMIWKMYATQLLNVHIEHNIESNLLRHANPIGMKKKAVITDIQGIIIENRATIITLRFWTFSFSGFNSFTSILSCSNNFLVLFITTFL